MKKNRIEEAPPKRKRKIIFQGLFLLFLIVGTIWVIRQNNNMTYHTNHGFIFGTQYNITYKYDKDLQSDIEAELQKVDNSLSPFNKQSIITKVNNNEEIVVDRMFKEVFLLAMNISKETDGAFDITVAPLVNVWGFGFKNDQTPNEQSVDSLRQFIGYQKVKLSSSGHVTKEDPRIMLDCSAIAKGYGCDAVARLFNRLGINNYMVEIGGEVVTRGESSKQQPWHIGVSKPTDDSIHVNNGLQTILNVTNYAMATSGNYRNFYYKDGVKYAHTIDPRTGYPVQHSLLSATVLAKDCATADAYATSFMVLGVDKAKEILRRHPELMAYFIYAKPNGDNAVWFSDALREKIIDQ